MRKFVNGKYVACDAPATCAKEAKEARKTVKMDISKKALELMNTQPAGFDWSGLKGSGGGGQVTVADVKKFIAAQAK